MPRGKKAKGLLLTAWPSMLVLLLMVFLSMAPWSGTWAAPGQSVPNQTIPGPITPINTATGGTASSADANTNLNIGAGITSPSGIINFSVSTVSAGDPTLPSAPGGFVFAGRRVFISADVDSVTFGGPGAQICFTYSDADVPAGVNENELKIKRYNSSTGLWEDLSNMAINTTTNVACGYTTSLSYFALFAPPGPTPVPVGGGGGWVPPTATPIRTPTPVATPTATVVPEPTPTPTRIPVPTPTPIPGVGVKVTKGWNLISTPRNLVDPSVGAVLGGVADRAFYYNASTKDWDYATVADGAWTGNLKKIEEGKGYWINAIADGTLVLNVAPKDPLAPLPVYSLEEGWNLIGYTSRDLVPATGLITYLGSLSGNWVSAYRYDPAVGFELGKPGYGFSIVELGRGYWINLTSAGQLFP